MYKSFINQFLYMKQIKFREPIQTTGIRINFCFSLIFDITKDNIIVRYLC